MKSECPMSSAKQVPATRRTAASGSGRPQARRPRRFATARSPTNRFRQPKNEGCDICSRRQNSAIDNPDRRQRLIRSRHFARHRRVCRWSHRRAPLSEGKKISPRLTHASRLDGQSAYARPPRHDTCLGRNRLIVSMGLTVRQVACTLHGPGIGAAIISLARMPLGLVHAIRPRTITTRQRSLPLGVEHISPLAFRFGRHEAIRFRGPEKVGSQNLLPTRLPVSAVLAPGLCRNLISVPPT